jgi:DNA-binding transcriptional regulator YiaG
MDIKALRQRLHLRREEFATMLNVSYRTIANWEAGKAPGFLTERRIEQLLRDIEKRGKGSDARP